MKECKAKCMYRENGDLSLYMLRQEEDSLYRLVIEDRVVMKDPMNKGEATNALFTVPKDLIPDFFTAIKACVDYVVESQTKTNQEV